MAAGTTYSPIGNYTVTGSSQRSYTFSSIPSTYTDLVLIVRGSAGTGANCYIRLNNDTAANYSFVYASGNGSTRESGRASTQDAAYIGAFYGNSLCETHIMGYSNSSMNKTLLSKEGDAAQFTRMYVNVWRSSSVVNAVTFFGNELNLDVGTTLSLYGIAAA